MSPTVVDVVEPRRAAVERARELADVALETCRLLAAWPGRADGEVPSAPKRVLVVNYGAVGDTIFFMPVLEALRAAWPEARLTYVADFFSGTDEVLPAAGLADEFWKYRSADLWQGKGPARRELSRRIAEGGFDVAVLGQGTPLRGLGPGLLRVPVRVGHCRAVTARREGWSALRYGWWRLRRLLARQELERRLVLNRKVWLSAGEHAVARNLRLVSALGLPAPEAATSRPRLAVGDAARAFARREVPDAPGKHTVGLHLGPPGTNYAKLWPLERWAEALALVARSAAIRIVVVGGPDERDGARRFAAAFGGECLELAGRASMLETFASIERCDVFAASDTGLSKAAMALGVPTVTVWGPVERAGYGAVWEPEKHTEVWHAVPCAPCVRFGTAEEGPEVLNFTNCGHHDCLNRLEVKVVADALLGRLGPKMVSSGDR